MSAVSGPWPVMSMPYPTNVPTIGSGSHRTRPHRLRNTVIARESEAAKSRINALTTPDDVRTEYPTQRQISAVGDPLLVLSMPYLTIVLTIGAGSQRIRSHKLRSTEIAQ